LHTQPRGEFAGRHAVETLGVQQGDGLGDDPLSV
jgi:hypothetical protein